MKKNFSLLFIAIFLIISHPVTFSTVTGYSPNIYFSADFETEIPRDLYQYNAQYFTITEFSRVPRSDFGHALKVSSVSGSSLTTGGNTGVMVRIPSLTQSSKVKLQFDMNVDSIPHNLNGNLLDILAAHNSGASNRWSFAGKSIYRGNGKGGFYLGNTPMDTQKWYTVSMEFDLLKHIFDVYITDQQGNRQTAIEKGALSELTTAFYQFIFVPKTDATFLFDNISIEEIKPPLSFFGIRENAAYQSDQPLAFYVDTEPSVSQLRVYGANNLIQTFQQGQLNSPLPPLAVIKPEQLKIGKYPIRLETDYNNNGTVVTENVSFSVNIKDVMPPLETFRTDFSDYTEGMTVSELQSATLLDDIFLEDGAYLSRVVSGGDVALKISENQTAGSYIQKSLGGNSQILDSEFMINPSHNSIDAVLHFGTENSIGIFSKRGTIGDTVIPYQANIWYIVKTRFDSSEGTYKTFVYENKTNLIAFLYNDFHTPAVPYIRLSFGIEGKSVTIDNFAVEGKKIQPSYIYMNLSHGKGNFNMQRAPKDGIIAFAPLEGETVERLYFNRSQSNTDSFVDFVMPTKLPSLNHYMMEFEIYPVKLQGGMILFRAIDGNDNTSYDLMKVDSAGNFKVNGTTAAVLPMNSWTKIAIAYDLEAVTCDVYINDRQKLKDHGMSNYKRTSKYRLGVPTGSGVTEFYADNIKIYDGYLPADTTDFFVPMNSVMETEPQAKNLIGAGSVFMADTDYFYTGNSKRKYSDYHVFPYTENETLMMPSVIVETLGVSVVQKESNITIGNVSMTVGSKTMKVGSTTRQLPLAPIIKEGILYLPIAHLCKYGLGMNLYEDDRSFIMVSYEAIPYQNSPAPYLNREPIDVIYRYLQFERPGGEKVIQKLKEYSENNRHPRILITPERVEEIKYNMQISEDVSRMYDKVIAEADALLNTDLVKYNIPDGLRLFGSCITVRNRIITLSIAYLLSDDTQYAQRIWEEMENACNWKDWNTGKHFLDSGKLGPGIAIGYDVCYDYLTEEQRAFIRQKTREHYLDFCVAAYGGTYSGSEFRQSFSNWGAVCSGSILTVCLAFADDAEDELADICEFLIGQSMQSLEFPIGLLYPDGAWYEGLGYWEYVVEYVITYGIGPLMNSCGDDFGLLNSPGLKKAIDFGMYMHGPSRGVYNYSDQGETASYYIPCQGFQLALLTGDRELMDSQFAWRNLTNTASQAMDILFYNPGGNVTINEEKFPLDRYFKGAEIGIMKQSWDSRQGSFAGIRGGLNTSTGSHFDKGSFVFEADGERWVIDLGKDNYNIEGGYFGANGYTLYRKRTEGHNSVVINPRPNFPGQVLMARTYMESSESKPRGAYMNFNLNEAYAEDAHSFTRGFYFGDERKSLTVRDEFDLKGESDVYWFMHTRANIHIDEDGKGATLTQNGKTLKVDMVCNASDWHLEERDTKPFAPEHSREGEISRAGIRKLTLVARAAGNVSITAKLMPRPDEYSYEEISDIPMSQWVLPDGILKKEVTFYTFDDINRYRPNEDIDVGINIPSGFSQARIYAGGVLIKTIYEEMSDGQYFVSLPYAMAGFDFAVLRAEVDYDGYTASASKRITLKEFLSSREIYFTDVSAYTDKMTTESEVKNALNLTYVVGKSGYLSFSKTDGIGGSGDTAIKITMTDARSSNGGYFEKNFEKIEDVADIYFDIYPSGTKNNLVLSYKSDTGVSPSPATIVLLNSSGKFGASGVRYEAQNWYKVHIRMDIKNDKYTVKIKNQQGNILAIYSGTILIDNLIMARITFLSPVSAGAYFSFDNFGIRSNIPYDLKFEEPTMELDGATACVSVKANNNASANVDANLIIAVFDQNNKLVELKIKPYSLETGQTILADTVRMQPSQEPYKIKLMIWNSLKMMNAMFNSTDFTADLSEFLVN